MSPLRMGATRVAPVRSRTSAAGARRSARRWTPARASWTRHSVPGPGRSWPVSGSGRRSPVGTPWSRWPAPPGAGSPACSTTWSAPTSPRSAPAGPRRPRRRRPCGAPSPPPSCWTGSPWGPGTTSVRGRSRRGSPWTGWCCSTCPTSTPAAARAPGRGRPGAGARRRLRVGDRPAEVRRRPAAPRLPGRPDRARRRHASSCSTRPTGSPPTRWPPAARTSSGSCRPTVWTPGRCWSPPPGTAAGWWTCSTGSASWWQGARPPCTGSRATCARSPGSCGPRWPTPSRGWASGSTPAWSTRCPGRRGCRWSWPPSSVDYRREAWSRTGGRSPGGSGPCSPTRCGGCGCAPTGRRPRRRGAGVRDGAGQDAITAADVRAVLGGPRCPATPAARSAVELATRDLGDRAGAALPQRWADAVAAAATPPGDDLGRRAGPRRDADAAACPEPAGGGPRSTRLQWLLALSAVLGLAWLAALAVMAWLRLPALDTPRVGILPAADPDAARRAACWASCSRRSRGRWRGWAPGDGGPWSPGGCASSVWGVAQELIIAPVQAVLDRHRTTRERLESLPGPPAALSVPARLPRRPAAAGLAWAARRPTCPPRVTVRAASTARGVLVPSSTGLRGLVTGARRTDWSHPPLTAGTENR